MTRTDKTQTYHTLCRCTAELRGVSARLRDTDPEAAQIIEGLAADVLAMWHQVKDVGGGSDEK